MPNNINPAEVSKVLLDQLKSLNNDVKLEEVGTVLQISDFEVPQSGMSYRMNRNLQIYFFLFQLMKDRVQNLFDVICESPVGHIRHYGTVPILIPVEARPSVGPVVRRILGHALQFLFPLNI